MAKISSYPQADVPLSGSDMLIGTDVLNDNETKNFTISELAQFIETQIGPGTIPTLQQVLDNDHDLLNGNNFQGNQAGDSNTGQNVIGFGFQSASTNSGNFVTAIGFGAAQSNSKSFVNAIGQNASIQNSGDNVNAFGSNSGNANSGNYLNAFGQNAGKFNTGAALNAFGTNSGESNEGTYVNAFGGQAAKSNKGTNVVAIGQNAALNNEGSIVYAIGQEAATGNIGNYLNAIGINAAINNSGTNVIAIGESSAQSNQYNFVNLFGYLAEASNDEQTVLAGSNFQVTLNYIGITADRNYNMPDADGTLVLSVNGTAPDAAGNVVVSVSAPYTVYTATLTQAGTAAPVANVLQNTLGGTVVWARIGVGAYTATLNGAFALNKTVCFVNTAISNTQLQAYRLNGDTVELDQQDFSNVAIDGLYSNCIEIRVYP